MSNSPQQQNRKLLSRILASPARLTVQQRINLVFSLVALLFLSAGLAGFTQANRASKDLNTLASVSDMIKNGEQLRSGLLEINITLDQILLTRNATTLDARLTSQLTSWNTLLSELVAGAASPDSAGPLATADARPLLQQLQNLGAEQNSQIALIMDQVRQGEWVSAQNLRMENLPRIQTSQSDTLTLLRQLLQEENTTLQASATRNQAFARLLWLSAAMLAIVITISFALLFQRSLFLPLAQISGHLDSVLAALAPSAAADPGQQSPGTPSPASLDASSFTVPDLQLPANPPAEIETLWTHITRLYQAQQKIQAQAQAESAANLRQQDKRTLQIQAATQVGREVSGRYQAQELMEHAVNLIRDRFGFYHAGIFLLDQQREYAVLVAATGQAGQAMLEREHRLRVAGVAGQTEGIVGYVTRTGQPRIALDVTADASHLRNPLLPDTRSEMALPLQVSGQLIGALDVQSRAAQAFGDEDILILQLVADQLASAIQNARLLSQIQSQLRELENLSSRDTRQQWFQASQLLPTLSYTYQPRTGVQPIAASPTRPGVGPDGRQPTGGSTASTTADAALPAHIPLRVRGFQIGELEIWPAGEQLTPNELRLIEQIADRMSQALESARLYETAQLRALREQVLNELAANISRSLDVDALLRNTALELGRLPQVREASVHLTGAGATGAAIASVASQPPDGNTPSTPDHSDPLPPVSPAAQVERFEP